jgi:maltooligosyltrehalose trehalohydrolase
VSPDRTGQPDPREPDLSERVVEASQRLGATVLADAGVYFHVWAPRAELVELELCREGETAYHRLTAQGDGFHGGLVAEARAGDRYRYRLDGEGTFPDPASRSQPDGPHGRSEIVDPAAHRWDDANWPGLDRRGLVIYELHVGTFSPAGSFDGVIGELAYLRALGVTALQLMPVAEFPGRWNWGYDGVDLYAPASAYGGPAGLKRLVDAAHAAGLGVLLDVVYNHFGPDGNYLRAFSADYFTSDYRTPWGEALNYDGSRSRAVRQFIRENVRYWLDEYHLDGLRLDATHAIFDSSPRHILAELAAVAHERPRPALIFAEDHRNLVQLIDPPERGGFGLDGVWADDFHHALRTYLTGEREGYFADYRGRLEDLATTIEQGFLFQGQTTGRGRPRGTKVTDEPAAAFLFCLENHDQVGNRAAGERLSHLIDRQRYLLATAALLLAPETPLLFQGQEFAASAPFLYFTDHHPELGRLVSAGRREEFKQFAAFADPARRAAISDPQDPLTFERSRLDLSDRQRNAAVLETYQALLRLRRDDPVLSAAERTTIGAAVADDHLLAVHFWRDQAHRLLLLNFGDVEALLPLEALPSAPPPSSSWRLLFTIDDQSSRAPTDLATGWRVPARRGYLLASG